jgi:cellulose synthase/poly-beta-1,6-N-acetylglucosamine synthase-like glycosyltransferase
LRHSFAIVIPAHDEETGVADTVRSTIQLDYPRDLFAVYTVADNCSDGTAAVARAAGSLVLERTDPALRGKGHALNWAFERLLKERYDGFVVLDADSTISANALRVFDACLERGVLAAQADDLVSNADESVVSYTLAIGNILENRLFWAPKSRLGLPVFLRGTGMMLSRKLLERHPWRAASITEDTEYSIELARRGVSVSYLEEAAVHSPFPSDAAVLGVQRQRWAGGAVSLGKREALRLIVEGVTRRRPVLVDAGWTLLILSRPLVMFELALAMILSGISVVLEVTPVAMFALVASAAALLLHAAYLLWGVVLLGVTPRRVAMLLRSPYVGLRLGLAACAAVLGATNRSWARTPRL